MHWYNFDADAGDSVFIELVEGDGMEYMILELFDPQGADAGNTDSYGGAVVSIVDAQLQTGGTYSVRVRNDGVDTGSYTLSLNKNPTSTMLTLTPRLGGDACGTQAARCVLQGTIEFPGQVHWYKFDANAGDRVFIELVEGDGMEYMILELFDPQGAGAGNTDSYGGAVVSIIDAQLQTGGTYSVRVRNNGADTGSYTLSLNKNPTYTMLTLTPRLGGDACGTQAARCVLQGTIEFPGQVHWYKFDANAGDRVFIELVEGDGMEYMILELFDPQGAGAGNTDSYGGAVVSIIDAQLQTGGTYSVRVRNNGADTGSYTLSLNKNPTYTMLTLTPRLGGDACGTQAARCVLQGTIEFPGQVHWYKFDANAGDRVFIELVEGDGMEYMILELFDPQGAGAGNTDSYGGAVVSIIDAQLQTGGTYSVRVRNNGADTGSYTLSLNKNPTYTVLTLTPRLGGDACGTLVARCLIQGTIEFPGQVQWYSFDANTGDKVFIELVEGDGMEYMILELFDPQGADAGNTDSYGGAVVSIIDAQLQTGGTYSMRVRNDGVDTGSYTLSFNKAPP